MAHLHTNPGQRDVTASACIIWPTSKEVRCLVHMHRKLGRLLQVGGHIELDESPWGALAHEIAEESGYQLADLEVLQPYDPRSLSSIDSVIHPLPAVLNTHQVNVTPHFHTDLLYALVAQGEPTNPPAPGESTDLRWYTIDDLLDDPLVLPDNASYYRLVVEELLPNWLRIPADSFSTKLSN